MEKTYGLDSLVRISTDLKIIKYLETKKIEPSKKLLDSDLDANLK